MNCHPERSEGPALCGEQQVLRFAQDDKFIKSVACCLEARFLHHSLQNLPYQLRELGQSCFHIRAEVHAERPALAVG